MTTITLREYQSCETDLLTAAQAMRLRKHFRPYLEIERAWSGNGWLLTAKHYVGVLVLDELQIVIQPKIHLTNLFYMLTYAYDLPAFRVEETLLDQSEDLFTFIVKIFAQQVQGLLRQGLYHHYQEQETVQPYLRGRLLLTPHLRQPRTHATHFAQRINEYTVDLRENQILKYTLWLLSQLGLWESPLAAHLHHLYRAFNPVTHTVCRAADCRQIHYTRLNQRYATPLNLAALLLRHLSLEGGQGRERFGSYLFNMNEVFERFVGRYLQAHFQPHPQLEVRLQDNLWLDTEQQERGIPDIVIQHQGVPICVLDTKYKAFNQKPDPRDRDQIWIYSQRLQVKAALLVYPDQPLTAYRTTFSGIPLTALALPLTGTLADFRRSCQHFAETVIGSLLTRT